MVNIRIIFLALFVLGCGPGLTSSKNQSEKQTTISSEFDLVFDAGMEEYALNTIPGNDGSTLILAVQANEERVRDAWLFKLDATGERLWSRVLGGLGDDLLEDGFLTKDGDYVLVGQTSSKGEGGHDHWLVKLDSDGNVIWERTYGQAGNEFTGDIAPFGNDYIIVGSTTSQGAGLSDFLMYRVRDDGSVVWEKTYGGTQHDGASAVRVDENQQEIIVNGARSEFGGDWRGIILRMDYNGFIRQEINLGKDNPLTHTRQATRGTYSLDNGGLLVFGSVSLPNHQSRAWVATVDARGKIIRQNMFGDQSFERLDSFDKKPDGSFLTCGLTQEYGASAGWIASINDEGHMEEREILEIDSGCHSIFLNEGGGHTMAGSKGSYEKSDVWIKRTLF